MKTDVTPKCVFLTDIRGKINLSLWCVLCGMYMITSDITLALRGPDVTL